jgi:hypothetical protein
MGDIPEIIEKINSKFPLTYAATMISNIVYIQSTLKRNLVNDDHAISKMQTIKDIIKYRKLINEISNIVGEKKILSLINSIGI